MGFSGSDVYLSRSLEDLVVRSMLSPFINTYSGIEDGSKGSASQIIISAKFPCLISPLFSRPKTFAGVADNPLIAVS